MFLECKQDTKALKCTEFRERENKNRKQCNFLQTITNRENKGEREKERERERDEGRT